MKSGYFWITVLSAILAKDLTISATAVICREAELKCTSTGDSMLCVYKRVGTFIPPPSVFIDGKEACSSQYESLVVEGTYYNATGTASSCDNRQLSTMTHYAGALLIRPASFPALVEVSFTKKFENGSSLFINQCGGVESFSSYKEVLTSEATSSACACFNGKSLTIKRNLARASSLLTTITELMTCQ